MSIKKVRNMIKNGGDVGEFWETSIHISISGFEVATGHIVCDNNTNNSIRDVALTTYPKCIVAILNSVIGYIKYVSNSEDVNAELDSVELLESRYNLLDLLTVSKKTPQEYLNIMVSRIELLRREVNDTIRRNNHHEDGKVPAFPVVLLLLYVLRFSQEATGLTLVQIYEYWEKQ